MNSKTPPLLEMSPSAGKASTAADTVEARTLAATGRKDSLRAGLRWGSLRIHAKVEHTPAGLVALGACVTSILLGAATIVWVSTAAPRHHPLSTAMALQRLRKR